MKLFSNLVLVHTFVSEVLHESAFIVAKRNWSVVPKSIYVADMLGQLELDDVEVEEREEEYTLVAPRQFDVIEHEKALKKFAQPYVATWSLGFWLSSVRLNRPGFSRSGTGSLSNGVGGGA